MISANIVVKNEEEYLERVLIQVFKLADEILICDTGSTDSTLEIIKKFPKVILIQGIDRVCDARNKLLEKSTGDWIWIVDGDEVWPDEELAKLCLLFKQYPDVKAFGFTFKQMMPFGEAEHNARTIRLVKKTESLRWEGLFPLEILIDDLGKITTSNNPRKDIKFISDIKFIHYSGIKKSQWREKQPKKYLKAKQF